MATRREQARERTFNEIRQVARELLVADGPHAVTVNEIARRMGVSGPAIYRYYASHDDLVAGMTTGFFRELTAAIEAARVPGRVNLVQMSRALRRWALDHPAEFWMIFANPAVPAEQRPEGREDASAADDFGQVFFDEVEAIWNARRFPVPTPADMAPALRDQLEAYARATGDRLPAEALHVFLNCWIRLYGLLCMEVLRQVEFAVADAEPLFEDCLRELCVWLGIEFVPAT